MEEIIIQKINDDILVCILENGEIVEKYVFNVYNTSTIGNIYVGTVDEIYDGMQASFVDIGLEKKAFLSLKDALPKVDMVNNAENNENNKNKISNVLKKNQKLLLQIRKEAFEDKGPRVSTHITLAGNYLVLMPETDIVTVSQKIHLKSEKDRILKIVKSRLPKNYGCIVRTDAEGISENILIEDLEKVINEWNEIKNKYESSCKKNNFDINSKFKINDKEELRKRLIYDDNDIVMKIARDMVKKSTKNIYVNNQEIYQKLKNVISSDIINLKENNDFICEFGLQSKFEKTENRKVWLDCGAHIIIDKTEALTAIDVNSSRFIGNENLEKTIFKVNKEAAIEVMKQIRLKDIGGIIIIDFIDMHNQEYKDEILRIMREEQKKDRSKIEIKDFTQLNLVEMTRKKMYV